MCMFPKDGKLLGGLWATLKLQREISLDLFSSYTHQFHLAALLTEPVTLRVSGDGWYPLCPCTFTLSTWGNTVPYTQAPGVKETIRRKRVESGLKKAWLCLWGAEIAKWRRSIWACFIENPQETHECRVYPHIWDFSAPTGVYKFQCLALWFSCLLGITVLAMSCFFAPVL